MIYQIVEAKPGSKAGVSFRGGARQFWACRDHEQILSGPAETGKTFAVLHKLDALMWKYPGTQAAIVRKTFKSLHGSVIQSYTRKVANMAAIETYGGSRPEQFIYPNGSVIWLGGMDNPDKVLSSERDVIYVNQAEELTVDDWETLATRATGRAGNMPYALMMGDCNPGGSLHWILQRAKAKSLTLIKSRHTDNPALYNDAGNLTDQGERTMSTLKSLTGVRYKRLYLGEWATSEGAVYDMFDRDIHVVAQPDSRFVSWYLAMDEGYTNPAVILLVGEDPDGRLHIAREYYRRGVLQGAVVEQAKRWTVEKSVIVAAVDAAAAGLIADLNNSDIPAQPHKGRVLDGITAVQGLLRKQRDGLPRLTVAPSCVETINEFESYVWKPQKDEPVKENDHAMDAIRYLVVSKTGVSGPLVLFGA